jgi:hypothetical protein
LARLGTPTGLEGEKVPGSTVNAGIKSASIESQSCGRGTVEIVYGSNVHFCGRETRLLEGDAPEQEAQARQPVAVHFVPLVFIKLTDIARALPY